MIRHHPSPATLFGHAAGTLPPLHAHVLAVHLAQCPACRATLREDIEVDGALLQDLPPEPLRDGALRRTLARLDDPATLRGPEVTPAATTLADLAQGRWFPVSPGVRILSLARRDETGTRLDLIRVAPGTALPQHDHTGPEIACILAGAYRDETGEYHPGDIAEGEPGLDHAPTTLDGEECICLIATTGYLRAQSRLVRLIQPLFGI
jgi:putative transcriptional regulator